MTKSRKPKFVSPNKKAFTKQVKLIMNRSTENKVMNYQFGTGAAGITLYSYTNAFWSGANIFPISPYQGFANAAQGTSQGTRIGNQLTIKSAKIKLIFHQKPYNATTNLTPAPLLLKVITFYDKLDTAALPPNLPLLYQNGASATDPDAQGSSIDLLKAYNTDRYVVKSTKIIKLGWSIYNTIVGGQSTYQYHANNDFPMFNTYTLDYTKHLVKTVKYNDAVASPTSRGLFMAIFVMGADGLSILGSQFTCDYRGFIDIKYEDA